MTQTKLPPAIPARFRPPDCTPYDQDIETGSLYQRFRAQLRAFVSRRMPSAEADDLVQDVFLRAVEHQKRQTIENPRAFLFAVASNLMIDRIRRAEARGVVVHLPLETVEIEEASPSPLDVLLWEQQAALLRQAVAELDEPMRNALIMHRLDGLTLAEVACALGTTVPVVRGLIAKALAHCSKRLRRPTL